MRQEIKVMCGIPGSGKSFWAKQEMQRLSAAGYAVTYISRDEIRKSFIGEVKADSDKYFSRESDVFDVFISKINDALHDGANIIFVDATHISRGSRRKLLERLRPARDTALTFEVMNCGFETCVARNAMRTGFARVPDSAMKSMYRGFHTPTRAEFSNYQYGFETITINHHNNEEG